MQIMIALQRRSEKLRVFRFDSGHAFYIWSVEQGQPQRFAYGNKGWPDLTAGANGKTVGIEVKVGHDSQNSDQVMMQNSFSVMGWDYYLFDDKRDFNLQIDEVLKCLSI